MDGIVAEGKRLWSPAVEQTLVRAVTRQDAFGIVLLDAHLRVTESNVSSGRFRGLTVTTGQHLSDLVPASDLRPTAERLREVLATGNPIQSMPQRLRAPAQLVVDLTVLPLDEPSGGLVLVFRDVTTESQARHRLDMLYDASTTIGTSLDVLRTAQQLADAVMELGDYVTYVTVNLAVEVFAGREPPERLTSNVGLRRAALATRDGEPWPRGFLRPGQDLPRLPDKPAIAAHLNGEALWLPDLETILEALDHQPDLVRALVPADDVTALIHSPLKARGRILGSIEVWATESTEPFVADDLRLLTEVTSRAALSVDNARRFHREQASTVSLQRSMLPPPTVTATAVEAAGTYLPTTAEGSGAGGDWYDVIELPSLRVALVVGDVAGHGLQGAATMGRMRTAVQILAELDLPPDELLTHLDDFVIKLVTESESAHDDAFASTCLYAIYDPVSRRCTMASAGHPPPVIVPPNGAAEYVELSPGPPLGIGGLPFEVTSLILPPGSVLVLYTDGLVEHQRGDINTGMNALLAQITARAPLDPTSTGLTSIAQYLVRDLSRDSLSDDVTALLASTRAVPDQDVAVWDIPEDPAAVAEARAHVTTQLAAWDVPEEVAFTTELIISELVTNAIRYAGSPVALRLIRTDHTLVSEVSDPSSTQPRLRRARTTDEGGRGLFLVAQLSSRWGARYDGGAGKTIWAEQSMEPDGRTLESAIPPVFDLDDFDGLETTLPPPSGQGQNRP